jgi:hypothetical protein
MDTYWFVLLPHHKYKMRITELVESTKPNYFFDYGFDKDIKQLILKYWPKVSTLSCQDEAVKWFTILKKLGVDDVEIHDGFYIVNNDYENPEGHTWLEVNGSIFDPTAGQFDDHGEGEYETHEVR